MVLPPGAAATPHCTTIIHHHCHSHQTRVILPICIRHPTLNPQQTRGRSSPSSIRTSPIPNPTPPQIQAAHNNLPSPLPTPILSPSGQPRHPNMSG
eukprot:maker-scaffold2235_size18398-snap-gene-0.3 protein:Tk05074 transcript:maker-scaffold2235_size18398-snap-gene-0.3-mRNA-1 annotation:"tyrosine-protein kinase ryk"